MPSHSQGEDLLSRAYEELDLLGGDLVPTSTSPRPDGAEEWRSVGEWLMLAHRMGAERVFFVGDDPVVLFSRLPLGAEETDMLAAYRRAWSLARPRCLFLASEDELRVYALSQPPARSLDDAVTLEPLEVITRAADIADRLAMYHRESLESGALFDAAPYGSRVGRADVQLLHDVSAATDALVQSGLDRALAHTLIERVILVRYLEDREVVNRQYFEEIASAEDSWVRALQGEPPMPVLGAQSDFVACLTSKSFAYAVFERLARDFNGDLFVVSEDEPMRVTSEHLSLVYRLLTGAGQSDQDPLFLWAYDFSVVPTSLISSMYEEFYRAGTDDDAGTHYTPPELVEVVLDQALTPELLDSNPRVCDPACGSGIFLVEAFRRMVRHEMASRRRRLSPQRLQRILMERLFGVDVNQEAIRLAAFSLYLAYLNYQSPRDIRASGPLPRLIHRDGDSHGTTVLVVADAFSPTMTEAADAETPSQSGLPWPSETFDVVVGNPPWDEPKERSARTGEEWASSRGLPVGDRNPSQLFIWRALSILKPNGTAALLVAATALHNSRRTSQVFRARWLDAIELDAVVNFTPARSLFFEGGIAPFMLVKFRRRSQDEVGRTFQPFSYRTVRPSAALASTRSLWHARVDRRWVDQEALRRRDYLWKTYAWGSHHDDALMARLDAEKRLADFLPEDSTPAYGYQRGADPPSARLASLPSLRRIAPWGPLRSSWFESPPVGVKRQPDERLYEGQRLLIARGVRTGFGPNARIENRSFSFRHTIYCIPLHSVPPWQAKTILGVLLSALGRYRLFMASGSWGVWHDSLVPNDILSLPMRLAGSRDEITERITGAVDTLRGDYGMGTAGTLFVTEDRRKSSRLKSVLDVLDQAVMDLFDLAPAERDLVHDFHSHTLPLVGGRSSWTGQPTIDLDHSYAGTLDDITKLHDVPLRHYLEVFLRVWNRELAPTGEFSWRLIASPRSPMLAAVFETQETGSGITFSSTDKEELWHSVLDRLAVSLSIPITASIRSAGVLRGVSDTSVVVAKLNEARLWTASAAREDAEATILQAMSLRAS
jgi:hypothetical protein